jgi:hypothetical protein
MTPTILHPATMQLLRLQSRGRRRRLWAGFCQPRRLVLSAIACVLAVVWLGNAAMSIWLRETATPEMLRALLSWGLAIYAAWHFTKAAFFRPESPFDWAPAERDLLLAIPLRPRDLVAYQLASVTVTTLLKAGLFTLLLLPDLHCVLLGFAGLVLAMMTLEILRLAIDIGTWGMGRAAFLAYRAAVLTALVAGGVAVGAVLVQEISLVDQRNAGDGFLQRLLEILVRLHASNFGYVAMPFQPVIDLILADTLTVTNAGLTAATLATVMMLATAVIGLYAATLRRMANRERRAYRTSDVDRDVGSSQSKVWPTHGAEIRLSLRRIPRLSGAGALAWRQLVGARSHWGSLLMAMIAPAILALIPCFVVAAPHMALLATAGTLAFYTFLLLPTALRFDFRRDLDRLAILKGLPISPAAAAIGQTLAPVLIATLFWFLVLALTIAARSLPLHHLFTTMLVMIPLNVLVFGLDNLIYLLYPYRMQQEGLEIFVRTMLTFTGKGLLFTVGMVAIAGWGFSAAALTEGVSSWSGITISALAVFLGGLIGGLSLLASLVLWGLCAVYRSIDPIEGIPR